ncbi:MAG: enoyl-CoA hydratase-related protein [Acidimicrobiales bacterium]|nr:enoyl-CoA hydratase-related protein [Acidimicrobiales bacterium]
MPATTLHTADGVATITLADPDNRNALSTSLVGSLAEHLAAARADDDVRAVVLTNEGNTFCAGADLKAEPGDQTGGVVPVFEAILDSPTPVIGRVAGHCMGGGVGLAAACDISVITEDAEVGFTEVRIGAAPAMISVIVLPKLRRADALELFLSGERISAARAVDVGLFNQATPTEGLDAAVDEVIAKVVRGGPNALAASKRLIREVPELDRDAAFAMTQELSAGLFAAEEAQQGIAAFREKRSAPWVP